MTDGQVGAAPGEEMLCMMDAETGGHTPDKDLQCGACKSFHQDCDLELDDDSTLSKTDLWRLSGGMATCCAE